MKILVTGNLGYIGKILTKRLLDLNHKVLGIDTGFYEDQFTDSFSNSKLTQIKKDIRDITKLDLANIDAIIHLAALSNDPLGEISKKMTYEINYLATIKLAKLAKEMKIKRFIYSSSQSMYGISKKIEELDEDDSQKNPVTEYAKTKWLAEQKLIDLADENFLVCCFRPSTVFGFSPRLRLDIVYNNLVASAFAMNKIEILSDGSPWRPVVHIHDVASAFIAGICAPESLLNRQSYNVGIHNGNYTIKELANIVKNIHQSSNITFRNLHTDPRSYKVSFKKIFKNLSQYYIPQWDLISGANELVKYFQEIKLNNEDFRSRKYNRIKQILFLLENNKIDKNLRWK